MLLSIVLIIEISSTDKTDNLTCEIYIYDNFTCENYRFSIKSIAFQKTVIYIINRNNVCMDAWKNQIYFSC